MYQRKRRSCGFGRLLLVNRRERMLVFLPVLLRAGRNPEEFDTLLLWELEYFVCTVI
jgi:hypothetical protein